MAKNTTTEKPVDAARVKELLGNIEAGVREFGPLDLIDIHTSLEELLTLRNNGPSL